MDTSKPQPELWTTLERYTYNTWRCQDCGERDGDHAKILDNARDHAARTGHRVMITRRDETVIAGVRS